MLCICGHKENMHSRTWPCQGISVRDDLGHFVDCSCADFYPDVTISQEQLDHLKDNILKTITELKEMA